jgi:hypothetical protein
MIGNSIEGNLIKTIRLQIDSIANDMQHYFEKLSEDGKLGQNQVLTDSLFTAVLSVFVQCLRLRRTHFTP